MLGLYIHIPFCVTKCKYCDFNSFKIDLNEKIKYLNYLGEEMKLYKEEIKNREIDSVFVGGGTPSILNENEINILFEKIKENFNIKSNAEITMECNPGTLNKVKLKAIKSLGINRLSMGLQVTQDHHLKYIGRIHTYEQFEKNYKDAIEVGIDNINVDLMYSLPNQSFDEWKETLNKIINLKYFTKRRFKMDISKNRLEAFSDGVIAIIITIMVLDIPMPKSFTFNGIKTVLTSFFIYFISFIVVGSQWFKHNYLFSICNKISIKVVWRNILYLFFLSLMPYFTRLIIEYPKQVVPAIGYDIVFLLLMLSYSFMQHGVIESMLKEQNKHFLNKIKERRANQKFQLILIIIFVIFVGLIFYLSLYNPTISIVFFVILPVISSLSYLWGDSRFDQDARNKRINR